MPAATSAQVFAAQGRVRVGVILRPSSWFRSTSRRIRQFGGLQIAPTEAQAPPPRRSPRPADRPSGRGAHAAQSAVTSPSSTPQRFAKCTTMSRRAASKNAATRPSLGGPAQRVTERLLFIAPAPPEPHRDGRQKYGENGGEAQAQCAWPLDERARRGDLVDILRADRPPRPPAGPPGSASPCGRPGGWCPLDRDGERRGLYRGVSPGDRIERGEHDRRNRQLASVQRNENLLEGLSSESLAGRRSFDLRRRRVRLPVARGRDPRQSRPGRDPLRLAR